MQKNGVDDEFFLCESHEKGIVITKFDDEEEVHFSFWQHSKKPQKLSLIKRVKWSLRTLFRGHLYADEITLNQSESKRLVRTLTRHIN
jgi:hypothetical protein